LVDLFALLATVPDPRRSGWRRHPVGFVLAVALSAYTTAGFEHLSGAAQWAGQRSQEVLARLGGWRHPFTGMIYPPSQATLRRVLGGMDPDPLMRVCVAWTLAHLDPAAAGQDRPREQAVREGEELAAALRAVAVDGKSTRGARRGDGSSVSFLKGRGPVKGGGCRSWAVPGWLRACVCAGGGVKAERPEAVAGLGAGGPRTYGLEAGAGARDAVAAAGRAEVVRCGGFGVPSRGAVNGWVWCGRRLQVPASLGPEGRPGLGCRSFLRPVWVGHGAVRPRSGGVNQTGDLAGVRGS